MEPSSCLPFIYGERIGYTTYFNNEYISFLGKYNLKLMFSNYEQLNNELLYKITKSQIC